MYKHLYSHFLSATRKRGLICFTAHSHHFWPDVTREAVIKCWDDASCLIDDKWELIFSEHVPRAQKYAAELMGISKESSRFICIAPNTHEFVVRLLSCFEPSEPVRLLTTDSEFASFERQISRSQERPDFFVTRIPVMPFETFEDRFREMALYEDFDMIFFSQVFFNSGLVVDPEKTVISVASPGTMVVIDGYHAFGAIPTSLRLVGNRVFYLAGGYKYAQSGEGICFMYSPPNCKLRPENTGWFAEFGNFYSRRPEKIGYPGDASRFAGSTFDPTGLYRFNAVMDMFRERSVSVHRTHFYVVDLIDYFLTKLECEDHPLFNKDNRVNHKDTVLNRRAHFISYRMDNPEAVAGELRKRGVVVDWRGEFLRIGFGLYHNEEDADKLIDVIKEIS